MSFALVLTGIVFFSGLVMAAAGFAFRVVPARLRIHDEMERKVRGGRLVRQGLLNAVVSVTTIVGLALGLKERLFYEAMPPVWRLVLEVLGVLVLYDFLYYLMHRFPFHEWKVLKRVHSLHHIVRSPTAFDSLFVHPLETFLGVALLMLCTFIVGPVHVHAFAMIFLVYSVLNILIHSGLRFVGPIAKKHDIHHSSMRAGNYASITPLPDWIFGTLE